MQKLFSIQNKKCLLPINKSEKDLQQFICDNWKELFPEYIFITQEFQLKGAVHASGSSGRIDILAYNPETKRFVFFELKKNYNKNIGHQAANYRHCIKKNFPEVYLDALQKHKAELPNKTEIDDKEVEIILIAKEFTPLLMEQAESENLLTLIEYNWFENDLVLLDYVHEETSIVNGGGPIDYDSLDWNALVDTIRPALKNRIHLIPFKKENIDKLRELVEKVYVKKKRAALEKWLDKLEASEDSSTDTVSVS